jgi:peptidoglycan hydrolase-like protein with peptidoglycan-binding domain
MKVKHRNISNSISGVVLLGADTKKTYVRTIQSLLISNTYSAGSTVSVYIQSVNKAISDKQEMFGVPEGESFQRHNNAFYIINNLTIPKETAVDLFAGFPKGFSYSSNYELVVVLGNTSHSVSTILAYE